MTLPSWGAGAKLHREHPIKGRASVGAGGKCYNGSSNNNVLPPGVAHSSENYSND